MGTIDLELIGILYTWFLGILLCFFDWGGDSTLIRRFFFWAPRYLLWVIDASVSVSPLCASVTLWWQSVGN